MTNNFIPLPIHSDESSDDESVSSIADGTLGGSFVAAWIKRRCKIDHAYATCAWALSVLPQVREDVAERMTGEDRKDIEEIVKKLHSVPNPNKGRGPDGTPVAEMDPDTIVDLFWDEFLAFQKKTSPFDRPARWNATNALKGQSHLWHEKYSTPYTSVLGFVACRVCSKVCGIGAAERSWGDVKQIKSGKRLNISGEYIEKRAVLFTTAHINDARIRNRESEKLDAGGGTAVFGDDDLK